jgi:phage recombination protein Bet
MATEKTDALATTSDTLPEPVSRRGITEAEWRTLCNSLFPGANPQSVLLVVDYCRSRKLDPMKKPCHIVPMRVKDSRTGEWGWRDVVMAGIYEYRTTAQRTGQYLGHSAPEYGAIVDQFGVKAPEWCAMTFYRHSTFGRIEFPVRRHFAEVVGLKEGKANDRWARAPYQMLEKCVEAAGLREAFPDEFGGEAVAEESDRMTIEAERIEPLPMASVRKSQEPPPPTTATVMEAQTTEVPQAAPAPPKPRAANIGKVTRLDARPGGTIVGLDSGFLCGSADADLLKALAGYRDKQAVVELRVRPNPKGTTYAAILEEIVVQQS